MRKKIIFLILTGITSIFFSCTSITDIKGKYIKTDAIYILDSLIITDKDTLVKNPLNKKLYQYQQKIYNKQTKELLYKHWDYWYLKDDINFHNLLMDMNIDTNPDEYPYNKQRIERDKYMYSTQLYKKDIILGKDIATGKMRYYKKVE